MSSVRTGSERSAAKRRFNGSSSRSNGPVWIACGSLRSMPTSGSLTATPRTELLTSVACTSRIASHGTTVRAPPAAMTTAEGVSSTPLGSETRTSCRDLVVLVNQAAEAVPAPNAGGGRDRARRSSDGDTSGRAKRKASVGPLVVVVTHVLVEHALKMASTPDQHPVQTLLPDRPHPPLGERVGVRCLDRGRDDLGAVGGEDIVEDAGELGVAVTEQESTRCGVLRAFHLHR